MPPAAWLSALVLSACAVGCTVWWAIVLYHVVKTQRGLPTARNGLGLPEAESLLRAGPSVCVVIPAHNEAAVIAGLATSLRLQDYPRLRVVFALDRCTDDTEGVLRRAIDGDQRFEIHHVDACPEGWAGKVNAIWSAVNAAPAARDADLLLFADADTSFDPACVRACVALLQDRGLDLLSLLSTLTQDQWFELCVQPVTAMELMRQYPPLKANADAHGRPFANGQFMLFRREAYHAIGGHAIAKDELLEDIFLARIAHYRGHKTGVLIADGMLRCRMYPDYAAFRRGWKRIYIEGARRNPAKLRTAAHRLTAVGVFLPLATLTALFTGVGIWLNLHEAMGLVTAGLGLLGLLTMFAALAAAFGLGASRIEGVLAYPLGAALTASILAEAAADLEQKRAVEWGGKKYVRPVDPDA